MGLLSFLGTAKVEEAVVAPKAPAGSRAKQRNPNPGVLAIRIWWDGSVYPSAALVDKFDLTYRPATFEDVPAKDAEGVPGTEGYKAAIPAKKKTVVPTDNAGNGFDVIDSLQWGQYKGEGRMLFISPVAKNQPKVDLFGTTTYDDAGNPVSSVVDQGAATFGERYLVPLIKDVFGIELSKGGGDTVAAGPEYVDIVVFDELTLETGTLSINEHFTPKNGIGIFPKVISRGKDKGQADFERREKPTVYGFAPAEILNPTEAVAPSTGPDLASESVRA